MRSSTAAVLYAEAADWEVVELQVDPPRAGEVQVRFDYTGLCRSDESLRFGAAGRFPIVGGHEGAGVVEAVGPGVDDLQPGDTVVASIVPTCGRCRWCVTGAPYLCDQGAHALTGMAPDGSFRFHRGDDDMGGFCGLGAFSRYATVARGSVVRVPSDVPLDLVCLLACCVPTGWGSAVNAARVTPGDVVTIIGVGGVGSFAVQGALAAGASVVACIDPEPFKLQFAAKLGAHLGSSTFDEAQAAIADLTRGVMADKVIVTVGNMTADVVSQGFALTRKGGTLVLTGMSHDPQAETVRLPGTIMSAWAKTVVGVLYGLSSPHHDIPMLVDLWRRGQLNLADAVTSRYRLEDISQAYQDLDDGRNIRGVIEHGGGA
jgi:S-(hydroxymethyl)glutathione dehydrogenase/alcohol dehydrogenase